MKFEDVSLRTMDLATLLKEEKLMATNDNKDGTITLTVSKVPFKDVVEYMKDEKHKHHQIVLNHKEVKGLIEVLRETEEAVWPAKEEVI